jgi:hypothetical protein
MMAKARKIYALLSAQGTACTETALFEDEYTAENRAIVESRFCSLRVHHDPPIAGTWIDVSENEAFI